MRTFIEKNLQWILNQTLQLDPESRLRIHAIQNKIVTIELKHIDIRFQLIFKDSIIEVKESEENADTIIQGTPLSLLHMVLTKEDRKRFFAEDVSITGDIELGQKVIDLFDSLEIDFEEYLASAIGDVPANYIGRFARKIRSFNKNLKNTFEKNLNEYVHEEIDLFPASEALSDFFEEVDMLRDDVERLRARVSLLTKETHT